MNLGVPELASYIRTRECHVKFWMLSVRPVIRELLGMKTKRKGMHKYLEYNLTLPIIFFLKDTFVTVN